MSTNPIQMPESYLTVSKSLARTYGKVVSLTPSCREPTRIHRRNCSVREDASTTSIPWLHLTPSPKYATSGPVWPPFARRGTRRPHVATACQTRRRLRSTRRRPFFTTVTYRGHRVLLLYLLVPANSSYCNKKRRCTASRFFGGLQVA